MDAYVSNRSCYCSRCRTRGYMGPVVLITLGVLFAGVYMAALTAMIERLSSIINFTRQFIGL